MDDRLRVVFTHDIFRSQRHGGVSRYFVELHRCLRQLGVASAIAAGLHVNQYVKGVPGVLGWDVSSAPRPRVVRAITEIVGTGMDRMMLLRKGTIAHRTFYSPFSYKGGVTNVVTVFDLIHEQADSGFGTDNPTARRIRRAVEDADLVLAISNHTRDDLVERLRVPASKVRVTHLGVSHMRSEPGGARPEYGRYLLYVGGRAAGYKNFAPFLHAVADSRGARNCSIVCFGGGAVTSAEAQLVADLGLGDRFFVESGGDGSLAAAYRSAAALVYPSLYEGFGLPPLEAMAQRCPVVCSTGGALPETVGDAAIYFDPYDVASMSRAIERVLEDEDLCADLRVRGKQRARLFTWERTAAITLQAYESVVDGGR